MVQLQLKLVLFLLALLLVPKFGHATSDCTALLTADQLEILNQANQINNHFKISVYGGEVDGKPRTVVILGEMHVKNTADKELGKQILQKFNAYGVEAADTSKTWGGKALSVTLDLIFGAVKLFSKNRHTSTIHDSVDMAQNSLMVEDLKKKAAAANILGLTREEAAKVEIKIEEADGLIVTGDQLLDTLAEFEELAKNGPRLFNLEEGHQPNLTENVASVVLPVAAAGCLYAFATVVCDIGGFMKSDDLKETFEIMGTLVVAAIVGKIAKRALGDSFNRAMDRTLRLNRNSTMAKNGVKALEQNQDIDTILLVVGKNHNRGIGELLVEKYGFQAVPLEQVGVR